MPLPVRRQNCRRTAADVHELHDRILARRQHDGCILLVQPRGGLHGEPRREYRHVPAIPRTKSATAASAAEPAAFSAATRCTQPAAASEPAAATSTATHTRNISRRRAKSAWNGRVFHQRNARVRSHLRAGSLGNTAHGTEARLLLKQQSHCILVWYKSSIGAPKARVARSNAGSTSCVPGKGELHDVRSLIFGKPNSQPDVDGSSRWDLQFVRFRNHGECLDGRATSRCHADGSADWQPSAKSAAATTTTKSPTSSQSTATTQPAAEPTAAKSTSTESAAKSTATHTAK